MIPRFHRPNVGIPNPVAKNCGDNPECRCCAAIRRARAGALFDPLPDLFSPLTPGVQLANLSYSEDGRKLRADLGADWTRMLAQLSFSGEGMVMTRNAAAILGQNMRYPALETMGAGRVRASGSGCLLMDFDQLGAARAFHLRAETGHVFGVEFTDEAGGVVHRFTLTPESDMDEFFAWVRLHQACSAISRGSQARAQAGIPEAPLHAVRGCDSEAVSSVVAVCVDREIPLRVIVPGEAVTQQAEFIPRSLELSEGWWFASDDLVGLHFLSDLLSEVCIEERGSRAGRSRAALHAATEDGGTAIVLEAGDQEAECAWREILQSIA